MQIILASQSKRRQDILNMINLDYKIAVSSDDEIIDENLSILENCQNISKQKALNVLKMTEGDRIIIACDTVVVKDNILYGKPKDYNSAYEMLKKLNNTSHEVISCLTVLKVKDNIVETYQDYDRCEIFIDNLTDLQIESWIKKNKPFDKAGGYAIQEEFGKYVTKIIGDYYTVVGLPLNKLYNILMKLDVNY